MNKVPFIRKILAGMPGFANVDTFFYLDEYEHILSGFCCELTASGAYLWKFVYPLFDKFECLSLLYSQRFPGASGFISFREVPKVQLAEEFLTRIEGQIEGAREYLSLPQFCGCFIERPALLRNEHAEMVLGYAKVLIGQSEEALVHLRNASKALDAPYLADCNNIINLVENDNLLARAAILGFENEMKKRLKLPL